MTRLMIDSVSPEEYAQLKEDRTSILRDLIRYNSLGHNVTDVRINFKYNPSVRKIGLFLIRGGTEYAVEPGKINFESDEATAAMGLVAIIQERLNDIRIKSGNWIE
jgi:hypothetical protein